MLSEASDQASKLMQSLEALSDQYRGIEGSLEWIRLSKDSSGIIIEGNRSGLVELARNLLMVAKSDSRLAHQDLDKSHFVVDSEEILTISLADRTDHHK